MDKMSRRRFIEVGVAGAISVGGVKADSNLLVQESSHKANKERTLEAEEYHLLEFCMDTIVPAADNMPAATEAGGSKYLDELASRNRQVALELHQSLAALQKSLAGRSLKSLSSFSREQREKLLAEFEKQDAHSFRLLRNYTYESYYLQPQVRQLIGYELYPTNGPGPMIEPFDESILVKVRKKPKFYREV